MKQAIALDRLQRTLGVICGKDTAPEVRVRRAAHGLGLRFRLHRADLPGTPDLLFTSRRLAVFVHGCFWHRHPRCPKASAPSSEFWATKFKSNVARDRRVEKELRALGWDVIVIWECETKKSETLARILTTKILRRKVGSVKRSASRLRHRKR
ncbi:very short patch repair endonuclease [Bradyrhizobium ivorense]|uniref:very short patch repair endonuclease n=1 Tax=Bradyrhizobium ivorense TaxID=2511166 RepID=UPI001121E617|nr:very short patch repair endonuclease [Bradyrhizobium ivorense]